MSSSSYYSWRKKREISSHEETDSWVSVLLCNHNAASQAIVKDTNCNQRKHRAHNSTQTKMNTIASKNASITPISKRYDSYQRSWKSNIVALPFDSCRRKPQICATESVSRDGLSCLQADERCLGTTKLLPMDKVHTQPIGISGGLEYVMEKYGVAEHEKGLFLHHFYKMLMIAPEFSSVFEKLRYCLELTGRRLETLQKLDEDHAASTLIGNIYDHRRATILSLQSMQRQYPYLDQVGLIMEQFERLMDQYLDNGREKHDFLHALLSHLEKRNNFPSGTFGILSSLDIASRDRFGFQLAKYSKLVDIVDCKRSLTLEALKALLSRYEAFQRRQECRIPVMNTAWG